MDWVETANLEFRKIGNRFTWPLCYQEHGIERNLLRYEISYVELFLWEALVEIDRISFA